MDDRRTLVFLHGAGGPIDSRRWLGALNERMSAMGYSPFAPDFDEVLAPTYMDQLLAGAMGPEPAFTFHRGSDEHYRRTQLEYLQRLEEISRVVRGWERMRSGPDLGWAPGGVEGSWAAGLGVNFLVPVRKYQNQRECRWAAQRAVLVQLPTTGSVILVAHSLGSVVAVDLLTKLPPGLHVELLVTIGSPLAIGRLGHPGFDRKGFPFERVGAWVNLYDSGDLVTVGRGVSGRFPAACDVSVQTGEAHDAMAYLSNPAVAAAIGHHAYGDHAAPAESGVQRLLHPAWHPLLLSFAYSHQLSACAKGQDWSFKARVDTARRILAQRAIGEAEATRDSLNQQQAPSVDASPVGPGRYPTAVDLMHHAADLVRDVWTDDALVSLAVALAMSAPLPPFDVDVSDERRHEALVKTLNLVRHRQGNVSDQEFAEAVRDAVKAGKAAVSKSSFPWGTVLVGGGLVLLSLTGVGLLVAAPAGLAGAALVTGTLAAFGPGGMVGGLVTIATMTGVGAAATGIGVGVGASADPMVVERARRLAVEEVAGMGLDQLRNALAGVLAVVDAQRRLHLQSTAVVVAELLRSALDAVQLERTLHAEVAPGRQGTKELAERVALLQRAVDWLVEHHLKDDPTQKARNRLAELPESLA